jgi:hypothetical protein
MVAAGRVAEMFGEVRHHRLDDARIDRRGRVIVHVNRKLDRHRFLFYRAARLKASRSMERDGFSQAS